MNEPRPDDPQLSPLNESEKLWLSVVGIACVLLVWLGISASRDLDPIVEPTPEALELAVSDEQRVKLSPRVRELLEKIEAGALSGEMANDFVDVFAEATKTSGDKQFRTYHFSLDGHTGYLEGHPVVYVQVQLKSGRIIHCGVAVPCY